MKVVNKLIPIILILILAGIGFLIYGWSQNGRYNFHLEKSGVFLFWADSRTGEIKLFYLNNDLKFELLDTVNPKGKMSAEEFLKK